MTRVSVCTDSSSLLPAAAAATLGVDVVQIGVAIDGERLDEAALSLDEFYNLLEGGARATTSQPSPAAFAGVYEQAVARGAEDVLSIHLDARASGTASVAALAAAGSSARVRVVDSGTVSYGVAVCVRSAADALEAGASVDEAVDAAVRTGAEMRNAFVARSGRGRLPKAEGWPVLGFGAGSARAVSRCDSVSEAIAGMAQLALTEGRRVSVAVGHAARSMESAADDLAHRLVGQDDVEAVERYRVGAAIGAHTGPASFGLFWWPAT